jgi:hypothetical protein
VEADTEGEGGLPWERSRGPPTGVGVCFSGGAFELQRSRLCGSGSPGTRGLFAGARSADFLAAVSGGSYVGGALTLNAAARATDMTSWDVAPFAEGSPEAEHVLSNGAYLFEDGIARTGARFAVRKALNLESLSQLLCITPRGCSGG